MHPESMDPKYDVYNECRRTRLFAFEMNDMMTTFYLLPCQRKLVPLYMYQSKSLNVPPYRRYAGTYVQDNDGNWIGCYVGKFVYRLR